MEKGLNILESISLTRLPDESFRGIVNFIKANRLNASMTKPTVAQKISID